MTRALELNPFYGEARYNLAQAWTRLGNSEAAQKAYLRIVESNRSRVGATAQNNLGSYCGGRGSRPSKGRYPLLPQARAPRLVRAQRYFSCRAPHLGVLGKRAQTQFHTHIIQRASEQRLPVCPG